MTVGANLVLNEANASRMIVEIKNENNGESILSVYVDGGDIYFDFGELGGNKPFYLKIPTSAKSFATTLRNCSATSTAL